jgi:hypothetical protein
MSIIEILLIVIILMLIGLMGTAAFVLSRWRHFQRFQIDQWATRYAEALYLEDRLLLANTPLFEIIATAERSSKTRLTRTARQMQIIPIAEQISDGRPVEWTEVEKSVLIILASMREDSSEASRGRFGTLNAIAVIRAFYNRFCNIPPFCSRTEEPPRRGRT